MSSASKRQRQAAELGSQVSGMLTGAQSGALAYVLCRGRGCREKLAAIRFEPGGVIAFEIRAPIHDEHGLVVLERPASMSHPGIIVRRRPGARAAFRCAACGYTTTVDLRALEQVRPTG